jgi:hypothetical protein
MPDSRGGPKAVTFDRQSAGEDEAHSSEPTAASRASVRHPEVDRSQVTSVDLTDARKSVLGSALGFIPV